MDNFWTEHWWAIPAWLLGVFAMLAVLLRARRRPDARRSRVVSWLFPFLDPDRRPPSTRRLLALLVVGALILFLAWR